MGVCSLAVNYILYQNDVGKIKYVIEPIYLTFILFLHLEYPTIHPVYPTFGYSFELLYVLLYFQP